ncbi:putative carboxylesterase [Medicago truncatula]|nr:protein EDS1L [Medicago truncatula]RHN68862.1 putative carboxylesterase [Medicago truncatula]
MKQTQTKDRNMGGGLVGDNIGLNEEVIKKTCSLSFKAHNSENEPYISELFRISSDLTEYLVLSFPGSWVETDWFVRKSFGETKIDLAKFPLLKSVGNDETALVNQAFFNRFERLLKLSSFVAEVKKAIAEGKQVVFTGHSSGAVLAILATFWALEEYLYPTKIQIQHKSPMCVTFGSPLVGNHIFSHASNREKWSHHFIHFVMQYDIVPRIFLAPFSSIEKLISPVLQLLTPNNNSLTQDPIRDSVTCEFYSTVMRNAATVTSHVACNLMGSTNLLLETMTNFVELSPYRPFGTYIFCNGNGQMIVVKNSDAVLQLMFHIAQLRDLAQLSEVANKSILQHLAYEAELEESLGMQNVVYLNKLDDLPLSSGEGHDTDIAAALDSLGLSARARLCLRAAGELEKQKERNEEKIKKEFQDKAVPSMRDLEEYKSTCEINNGKGYYDAFKVQKEPKDFQANVKRLVLAGVWDEIIEMLKRYELPDEFEGKKEWIEHGTRFRRLVEPLDIANYHRHLKNEDTGPYMNKARPKRYRYTQRWLEHANRSPKAEITESTFWAEVEELCSWTSNNKPFEDIKERVLKLEQDIKMWTDKEVLTKDVLSKDPTFIKLWETLPQEHKATSCISTLFTVKE